MSVSRLEKLEKLWKQAEGAYSMKSVQDHPITKTLLTLLMSGALQGTIIDLGCGLGYRTAIAEQYGSIIGIDVVDFPLRKAKKRDGKLQLVRGDLTAMPFASDVFDGGFMLATIEHVDDINALLQEIQRVVKTGGSLLISVTDRDYHGSPMHVHVFTKESLKMALRDFRLKWINVSRHIIYAEVAVP